LCPNAGSFFRSCLHLLHAPPRQFQIVRRGLLRLLDEPVHHSDTVSVHKE
jgi:hypothetical protein